MDDHYWMRYGFVGLLALASCGEPGERIVVVSWDQETQDYVLRAEKFETLSDVRKLDGAVTQVLGGAELIIDAHVLSAPTLEEAIERAVREKGNAVKFSAVEGEDGWVPADYHSLAMASIYRNLERAVSLFVDLGVPFDELGKIKTFYLLRLAVELPGTEPEVLRDNAAYSLIPGLDGFLILEQKELDDLPLGLNLGVIAHEYTHAVMARFRYGTPPEPNLAVVAPCAASMMEEGSADYFGFLATDDPAYISRSASPLVVASRDLSRPTSLTEQDVSQAAECAEFVDPHLVGSKWATTLWRIGEEIGHGTLGPVLVEALRGADGSLDPTLHALPDRLGALLDGEDAAAACAVLADRFEPVYAEIASCSGTP